MESELNRKTRELLEMFGVDIEKQIGKWVLEGHIVNLTNEEVEKALTSHTEKVIRRLERNMKASWDKSIDEDTHWDLGNVLEILNLLKQTNEN